ncbi:MAG: hypothetical protein U0V70_06675 [Terriglobia bacterium]
MCPVGKMWSEVLVKDDKTGESHALAVLDPFSENRYDVYWKPAPEPAHVWKSIPRHAGAEWKLLDDSAGVVLTVPMRDGAPFCVFGDASGFRHDFTRIKEHSFRETGGWGWVSKSWDHWPIGWLNSQAHEVDRESLKIYPNHFSPAGMDFWDLPNEQSARRVFYSLIGIGGSNLEALRKVAKRWLDLGEVGISDPNTVAAFPVSYQGSH